MTISAVISASLGTQRTHPPPPSKFNILLLGETQSGKSTLIEGFRRYADPTCEINEDLIGDGLDSFTTEVRCTPITTSLPSYNVQQSRAGKDGVIRPCQVQDEYLSQNTTLEKYQFNINVRQGLSAHQGQSDELIYTFNLYDTPGLNDTNGQDEMHVVKIFDALVAAKDIHLVIVTCNNRPFTPEFQTALKCYFDMVPEFLDNLIFVHTHVDYKHLHPADKDFQAMMATRRSMLHALLGKDLFTHFNIDCNLGSKRPVRNCLTQNTLKDILEMALFNQPLTMKKVNLIKTPRMRNADSLIKSKYQGMIEALEMTLAFKNSEEGELLKSVADAEMRINLMLLDLLRVQDRLAMMDTDELELIYDHKFDGRRDEGMDPVFSITFPEQEYLISGTRQRKINITGVVERGGKGSLLWNAEFQGEAVGPVVFHARLYAKKRDKHASSMHNMRQAAVEQDITRIQLRQVLDQLRKRCKDKKAEIEELSATHDWCLHVLRRASEESIKTDVFRAMVQADAYIGSHFENSLRVGDIYLEMTRRAKRLDQIPEVLRPSRPTEDIILPEVDDSHVQRIVLVGRKSAGVSALANMLVQGDLFQANRFGNPGTLEMAEGRGWSVLDAQELIAKMTNSNATEGPTVEDICGLREHLGSGFHHFAYVVDMNDMENEPSTLFESFKEVFQGAESNFVLIATHCEAEDWVVDHKVALGSRFGNMVAIGCDFPLDRNNPSLHQQTRQACLQKLESRLTALSRDPIALSLPESERWSDSQLPLALTQARVRELASKTYDLVSLTSPRLFIVLPQDPDLWDSLDPLSDKFRLYFLCECGEHTQTPHSKTPHHVHLADHEGYDIERPTKFLEKYGSYLLTMMEMIKYGVVASGIIVPTSSQFDSMDMIPRMKGSLKYGGKGEAFASLVNDTILHLQNRLQMDPVRGGPSEQGALSTAEALESADLQQIGSFLRNQNEAKALGNLYRVATENGHVKWVCQNHYRENYDESDIDQLRHIFKGCRGAFDEQQRKGRLKLSTFTSARQFYNAMAKTRGIHELNISLDWKATKDDLQELQEAVLKAGILILIVHACALDFSLADAITRGTRFDPILQMMGNGIIQSFAITGCPDLWDIVSPTKVLVPPCLQRLELDYKWIVSSEEGSNLRILRQCSGLTELCIHSDLECEHVVAALDSILLVLPSLKLLEWRQKTALSLSYNLKYGKLVFSDNEGELNGPLPEYIPLLRRLERIILSRHDPVMVHMGKSGPVFGLQNPEATPATSLEGSSHLINYLGMQSNIWIQPGHFPKLDLSNATESTLALLETISREQQDLGFSSITVGASNINGDDHPLGSKGVSLLWDLVHRWRPSTLILTKDIPEFPDMALSAIWAFEDILKNLTELKVRTKSPSSWFALLQMCARKRSDLPLLKHFEYVNNRRHGVPTMAANYIARLLTRTREDVELGAQPLQSIVFRKVKMDEDCWRTIVDAIEFTELETLDFFSSTISGAAVNRLIHRMPRGLPLKSIDLKGPIFPYEKKREFEYLILYHTGINVLVDV